MTRTIDNWRMMLKIIDEKNEFAVPIMQGVIEGKEFTSESIQWLDIPKKKMMTMEEVFVLGEPDKKWYNSMRRKGYTDEQLSIKETEH